MAQSFTAKDAKKSLDTKDTKDTKESIPENTIDGFSFILQAKPPGHPSSLILHPCNYCWYCFASAGGMHWKLVVHWVSEHAPLVLTAT